MRNKHGKFIAKILKESSSKNRSLLDPNQIHPSGFSIKQNSTPREYGIILYRLNSLFNLRH